MKKQIHYDTKTQNMLYLLKRYKKIIANSKAFLQYGLQTVKPEDLEITKGIHEDILKETEPKQKFLLAKLKFHNPLAYERATWGYEESPVFIYKT